MTHPWLGQGWRQDRQPLRKSPRPTQCFANHGFTDAELACLDLGKAGLAKRLRQGALGGTDHSNALLGGIDFLLQRRVHLRCLHRISPAEATG